MNIAEQDFQQQARAELKTILESLVPPPNFRVVLEVDHNTENLILKVLHRTPRAYKIFGHSIWESKPSWEEDRCFQRCLTSRTYSGLLTQLKERPEFLEFELIYEGGVEYHVAMNL